MGRLRLLPVALLVLAACIPDLSADPTTGATPTPVPGARTGGAITIAIDALDGIDPTNAHDPATRAVARAMCDTLIALDPVTGAPRAGLAESWTIADDGRKLFVKLRADVRFHDGTALTAEDVAFTLTRLASEAFAGDMAHLMEPVSGYGFVHGDAETSNRRFREELVGANAIDARTVEITLDEPFADFYLTLANPATSPVPKAVVERDEAAFARAPVCTGPYRVTTPFEPGEPVRLERFDDYHGRNAGHTAGGAGYAETLTFVPFERPAAALRAYRNGEVDVAEVPEGVIGAVPGAVEHVETGLVELIGFPTTVEPFDDPAVRHALAAALDRATIARRLYREGRIASTAPLPGGPACATAPQDVDLSGVRARFYFNDEGSNRSLVRYASVVWRRTFGLRIEPVPMTWEAYLALGRRPQGFDGIFRYAWQADTPSPDRFLAPLFAEASIAQDNLTGYGDPTFEAALDRAREAVDDDERARAYADAAARICETMPMAPVVEDLRSTAHAETIASATGRWGRPSDGELDARELFARGGP